jgi:hypothetical protein
VVIWRRAQAVGPGPRMRATYNRNDGVRHLFAAYNLIDDKLFGQVKPRKQRVQFLEFCRYLRSLHPTDTRIAIICDNYSPHLTTKKDHRVGDWAAAKQRRVRLLLDQLLLVEPDRGPVHRTALLRLGRHRPPQPQAQASMICRYIIWRNNHAADPRLRKVVARANIA